MEINQLLAAIPEKNSEQVQQELKQPVSGDELGLIVAIKGVKINSCSIDEIKQILRLVIIKIGLRSQNWPSEEEKFVLVEHISKNYGNHTCEEIKLAFEMALAGKLEVEINSYENFSCLYFSNIMNAYREWAKVAYRQAQKTEEKLIQKIYTDEEILNQRREEIEKSFQAMKKGYYPLLHIYFKEVLLMDELIEEEETLGSFFVRKLNSTAENIYKKVE